MNRVAIAFMTKDRAHLSRETIKPLLDQNGFDLFIFDGSNTPEGEAFPGTCDAKGWRSNVRGGADTAIAFALTFLLNHTNNYTHVGLHENDVLITDPDWCAKTMALFDRGADDGLQVGAVSTRCYEDRQLIQRDGYAVCHNLGFGQQIMTREAARIALKHFRTGWTHVNRLLFSQLSGVDIGAFWAFRGGVHTITADWHFDTVLNAHGLASLALVPSPVDMIGQEPPLAEQGLTIAREPVTARINDEAFGIYRVRLQMVNERRRDAAWPGLIHYDPAGYIIYPHQIAYLGGSYSGDWTLRWTQGFGPFSWRARSVDADEAYSSVPGACPRMTIPILGSCDILVSGGDKGGHVHVVDKLTGFEAKPELYAESEQHQVFSLNIPSAAGYREIELTMLTPGTSFFGIRCREAQPIACPDPAFEHSWLPPVA